MNRFEAFDESKVSPEWTAAALKALRSGTGWFGRDGGLKLPESQPTPGSPPRSLTWVEPKALVPMAGFKQFG